MADGDIPLPDERPAQAGHAADIPLDNLPAPKGALSNTADDSFLSGAAKNFATSAVRGLGDSAAPLGTLAQLPQTVVDMARARWTKTPLDQVVRSRLQEEAQEKVRQAQWFEKTYGRPMPHRHTPMLDITGETVTRPVFDQTGEYEPTSTPGRYGSALVQGAFGMLGMGGGNAARRLAKLPADASTVKPVINETTKAAGAGAVAGGSGAVAGDWVGPEASVAAGFLVPGIFSHLAKKGAGYLRPMSPDQHQAMADELALRHTRDPKAALEKLQAEPKDSLAPTAEVTGDKYHATADKMMERADENYRATVGEKRGEQNAQRQQILHDIAPHEADAADVSKGFQEHLANLETANEQAQAKVPTGAPPDITGAALRSDVIVPQRDKMKGALSKAYNSVDPDGTMSVVTKGPRETAARLLAAEQDLDLPVSPLAKPLLEAFSKLGDVTPFQKLISLDQRITAAMKQAGRQSDPAHPMLVELKGAVKDSINKAIENQHEWEQQAVNRGDLHPGNTLAARLQRERAEWLAERKAGESAGTGTGPDVTAGSGRVPSASAGEGQSAEARRAASNNRVSGDEPPAPYMEPGAAKTLAKANQDYGLFSRMFRRGPVGDALKTEGFKDQFAKTNADVAGTAFRPGSQGYESTKAWLAAGQDDPAAAAHIQDMAVYQLRNAMGKNGLDQKTLDAWKAKHEGALRALEEKIPGVTKQFDDVATAQNTVRSFEQGAAKQFLGLNHADDIASHVGRLMNSDSGVAKISAILKEVQALPDGEPVVAGLRRAGATWLKNTLSNTSLQEGASGPQYTLSPHAFLDFVRARRGVLETLYTPEAVAQIDKLSEDMTRSRLVQSLQKVAGSDTTANAVTLKQYLLDLARKDTRRDMSAVEAAATSGLVFDMIQHGPSLTSALILGGKQGVSAAAKILDQMHINGASKVHNLFVDMLANPEMMRAGLERAVDAHGNVNLSAFQRLADFSANPKFAGLQNAGQTEDRLREGRAAGGSVKVDHAAQAAHLVRLVAQARKETSKTTEPMLKLPDATVSRALAIANERLA